MRASISTRASAAITAAGLSLAMLAGCTNPTGSVQGSNASSGTAADDSTIAFGKAYRYEDGLQITITRPKAYTPSDSAFNPSPAKHYLVMSVTLVNGTGAKYNPSAFWFGSQSGDKEGSQVFDSAKGVDGKPMTTLLNGRQAKFKVAFSAKDPKDFVLEVRPDRKRESIIFQLK